MKLLSTTCLLAFFVSCFVGCGKELPRSIDIHREAIQAAADNDHHTAVELLTEALESHQDARTYYDRAQSYLQIGDTEAALADCESGLALEPEDADLLWLKEEASKPRSKRFQGKNALPPSTDR